MTEYDEQDQAYQDLLEEANAYREQHDRMRKLISRMCYLIYHEAALMFYDEWLEDCISLGLYTIEEE